MAALNATGRVRLCFHILCDCATACLFPVNYDGPPPSVNCAHAVCFLSGVRYEPPHAPSVVFCNTLLCPRFQIFTPWKTSRRDICVQQYMHRSFFDEILDGGNPAGKDHNVRLVVSTRWDEMSHRIGVQFHCKVFHRKI